MAQNFTNSSANDLYDPLSPLSVKGLLVVIFSFCMIHARFNFAAAVLQETLGDTFRVLRNVKRARKLETHVFTFLVKQYTIPH
jgi:hypothetical protein